MIKKAIHVLCAMAVSLTVLPVTTAYAGDWKTDYLSKIKSTKNAQGGWIQDLDGNGIPEMTIYTYGEGVTAKSYFFTHDGAKIKDLSDKLYGMFFSDDNPGDLAGFTKTSIPYHYAVSLASGYGYGEGYVRFEKGQLTYIDPRAIGSFEYQDRIEYIPGIDDFTTKVKNWSSQNTQKTAIVYNGTPLTLDLPIINKNDRSFYPFRQLLESIGAEVEWNEKTNTAIGKLNGNIVEFTIGSSSYKVNGRTIKMEEGVTAFIDANNTYIPDRFAIEGLGLTVKWNEQKKVIDINDK